MRHAFFLSLLTLIAAAPAYPAMADDALPPPTEVQDTPEARETVAPPREDATAAGELLAEDRGDVEVRIVKRKDGAIVREYSLHGRVFMVKVTPVVGPSYYLYDSDGDGTFERRLPGNYRAITPPEWVIKRF